MAKRTNNSALVSYPVNAGQLNFSKENRTSLIQSVTVPWLSFSSELRNVHVCEKQMFEGPRDSLDWYSTTEVLDDDNLIQVTSETDKRMMKMLIFHGYMSMVPDGLEAHRTTLYSARAKSVMKLNCFPF